MIEKFILLLLIIPILIQGKYIIDDNTLEYAQENIQTIIKSYEEIEFRVPVFLSKQTFRVTAGNVNFKSTVDGGTDIIYDFVLTFSITIYEDSVVTFENLNFKDQELVLLGYVDESFVTFKNCNIINIYAAFIFQVDDSSSLELIDVYLGSCTSVLTSIIEILDDSKLTITNSEFSKNFNRVISVDSSTVSIESSKFTDNSREESSLTDAGSIIMAEKSVISVQDTIISNNDAGSFDGSFYLTNSEINLINTQFLNNRAKMAGAIYIKDSNLKIQEGTFEKNIASDAGGAIYCTHSEISAADSFFNGNFASIGGALYLEESNIIIQKTQINDNKCSEAGSGIYIQNSEIEIDASFFSSNTNGESSSFSNLTSNPNTAVYSSAVYATSTSMDLSYTHFEENISPNSGGALYLTSETTVSFLNGTFSGNKSGENGGVVVMLTSSGFLCTGCHFKYNQAKEYGGIGYLSSDGTKNVAVCIYCEFGEGNIAEKGGNEFYNANEDENVLVVSVLNEEERIIVA